MRNQCPEAQNKWSERRAKQTTLDAHLLPFFGRMYLDEISTLAIGEFTNAQRAKNLAAKTINNHLVILMTSLRRACHWDLLTKLPRAELLRVVPPAVDFLTMHEVAQLIAASEPGLWRAATVLAARTGMRFSEIAGLHWDSVDFKTRRVVIRHGSVRRRLDSTKSNRVRSVRLTSDVIDALGGLRRQGPLVFYHRDLPLHDETARRHLQAAAARAGLRRIGWHTLRHSFASELARLGTPLYIIKELLGHATIEMTQRYSHLGPSTLDRYVDQLDPLDSRQPAPNLVTMTHSLVRGSDPQFFAEPTQKDRAIAQSL